MNKKIIASMILKRPKGFEYGFGTHTNPWLTEKKITLAELGELLFQARESGVLQKGKLYYAEFFNDSKGSSDIVNIVDWDIFYNDKPISQFNFLPIEVTEEELINLLPQALVEFQDGDFVEFSHVFKNFADDQVDMALKLNSIFKSEILKIKYGDKPPKIIKEPDLEDVLRIHGSLHTRREIFAIGCAIRILANYAEQLDLNSHNMDTIYHYVYRVMYNFHDDYEQAAEMINKMSNMAWISMDEPGPSGELNSLGKLLEESNIEIPVYVAHEIIDMYLYENIAGAWFYGQHLDDRWENPKGEYPVMVSINTGEPVFGSSFKTIEIGMIDGGGVLFYYPEDVGFRKSEN
jgi:hypothetical protein